MPRSRTHASRRAARLASGEIPPDHLHDDALVAEFVGISAH